MCIAPDYADAHNNLANALKDNGRFDEAIDSYRTAINLRPNSAEFHSNLGNAAQDRGQIEAAAAAYRQAVSRRLTPTLTTTSGIF